MALNSKLFRGDPQLEACAREDSAHVTRGARGAHVVKIQQALNILDNAGLTADGDYGPATAGAVLRYKEKRNIVNRSIQSRADDIVGKMTIASLDDEMVRRENEAPDPNTCILRVGPGVRASSLVGVTAAAGDDDERKMQAARAQSLATLGQAIRALQGVQQAIVRQNLPFGRAMNAEESRILTAAGKWLAFNAGAPIRALPTIVAAVALMQRNLTIRNGQRLPPVIKRTLGVTDHALVRGGNVDNGVECGDPFFTVDGPNCRRDVITHEFVHFLGVRHGGGALDAPTPRDRITTPNQALDSADNLAQLVAEITTLGAKTDACARANE